MFFRYLKLRVHLVNEPFSLVLLEPPVVANNFASYLHEKIRLKLKCYNLKLISSSYDVPQWRP